jgi:hypothetical protein
MQELSFPLPYSGRGMDGLCQKILQSVIDDDESFRVALLESGMKPADTPPRRTIFVA